MYNLEEITELDLKKCTIPIIILTNLNKIILKYQNEISYHYHAPYDKPTGHGDVLLAGFTYL